MIDNNEDGGERERWVYNNFIILHSYYLLLLLSAKLLFFKAYFYSNSNNTLLEVEHLTLGQLHRRVPATLQTLRLLLVWSAWLWGAAGWVWRPVVPQDIEQFHSLHTLLPDSPQHRSTTTWDDARTTDSCQHKSVTCVTKISLDERCIKSDCYWIYTLCTVHAVRFYTTLSSTAVCQFY